MAWTDVKFADVNPNAEPVAEGEYVVKLERAYRNKFDADAFDVKTKIATECQFRGQNLFLKFPNPDKVDKNHPGNDPRNWVNKQFKRFTGELGVELPEGEHPVEFLNQLIAEEEHGIYLRVKVKNRPYQDKNTGDMVPNPEISIGSVKKAEEPQTT